MTLTNLTAKAVVSLDAVITKAADLSTPRQILTALKEIQFTFGAAGALQTADQIFHDRRLIAGGATDELDLTDESLSNPFGEVIDFDIIRLIAIFNRSDLATASPSHIVTDAAISFGGAAATFFGPLGTTAPAAEYATLAMEAGTGILLVAPSAAGWAVVDTTGDDLSIINDDGADQAMYDIILIGDNA